MPPGGGQPAPAQPRTGFSTDGFWWWDGAEWRPALSADRLWRWDGRTWVPNTGGIAEPISGGLGTGVTIVIFVGLVALVTALAIGVLLTGGGEIGSLFANAWGGLTGR